MGGKVKVLLSKPYKDKEGHWQEAGREIDLPKKEAERVAGKGGCVELVTRSSGQDK